METQEDWESEVKKQFLERLDFLSDHWVNGDDRPPFSFGGWREEVAEDFVKITRTQREQARREGKAYKGENGRKMYQNGYRDGYMEAFEAADSKAYAIHCSSCVDGQCYGTRGILWMTLQSLKAKLNK